MIMLLLEASSSCCLKRERIKRRLYSTRGDAKSDIFDYIEMFYNSKRKHGSNNLLSPVMKSPLPRTAEKCLSYRWRFRMFRANTGDNRPRLFIEFNCR